MQSKGRPSIGALEDLALHYCHHRRQHESVVTWGSAAHGGDSSAVQNQLKKVQQIQNVKNGGIGGGAFAAVLGDGSVVTWGRAATGGDSSAVQDQLKNVQQIQASFGAFAAVLGDGSVVTWGSAASGGDSSAVQDQLKSVKQIQVSACAFAAVLGDGSVVTWGSAAPGGDSSAVAKNCSKSTGRSLDLLHVLQLFLHGTTVTTSGSTTPGQVTTDPSPRTAANAQAETWICLTLFS